MQGCWKSLESEQTRGGQCSRMRLALPVSPLSKFSGPGMLTVPVGRVGMSTLDGFSLIPIGIHFPVERQTILTPPVGAFAVVMGWTSLVMMVVVEREGLVLSSCRLCDFKGLPLEGQ